ncbi:hypothetical protein, partial [Burkholderia pseudomallei]|uniref:hypothetical protein n=1 Tax=Burkholderia pseudomallei TaxID=28450 RepID=UPI001CA4B7E2
SRFSGSFPVLYPRLPRTSPMLSAVLPTIVDACREARGPAAERRASTAESRLERPNRTRTRLRMSPPPPQPRACRPGAKRERVGAAAPTRSRFAPGRHARGCGGGGLIRRRVRVRFGRSSRLSAVLARRSAAGPRASRHASTIVGKTAESMGEVRGKRG